MYSCKCSTPYDTFDYNCVGGGARPIRVLTGTRTVGGRPCRRAHHRSPTSACARCLVQCTRYLVLKYRCPNPMYISLIYCSSNFRVLNSESMDRCPEKPDSRPEAVCAEVCQARGTLSTPVGSSCLQRSCPHFLVFCCSGTRCGGKKP